jgi:hypothetical protein
MRFRFRGPPADSILNPLFWVGGSVFLLKEEEGCCLILHLLGDVVAVCFFVLGLVAHCLLVVATCTSAFLDSG